MAAEPTSPLASNVKRTWRRKSAISYTGQTGEDRKRQVMDPRSEPCLCRGAAGGMYMVAHCEISRDRFKKVHRVHLPLASYQRQRPEFTASLAYRSPTADFLLGFVSHWILMDSCVSEPPSLLSHSRGKIYVLLMHGRFPPVELTYRYTYILFIYFPVHELSI